MAILITRDGEVKVNLPRVDEKSDGTLWFQGKPLLAISDPEEKAKVVKLVKAKKYDEIPAEHFVRMGDNPENVWVGEAEEWYNNPERKEAVRKREEEEIKRVEISLSTRGWGDYSSVTWDGDITRPDTEILTECRELLANGHDVDERNQTDDEILVLIHKARGRWVKTKSENAREETKRNEIFSLARTTGERQTLESWMTEDCSENLVDCSFDYAVKWAMPDGTTKVTYQHCP